MPTTVIMPALELAQETGKVLKWDAAAGKVTNKVPEAQAILDGTYRKGWELAV